MRRSGGEGGGLYIYIYIYVYYKIINVLVLWVNKALIQSLHSNRTSHARQSLTPVCQYMYIYSMPWQAQIEIYSQIKLQPYLSFKLVIEHAIQLTKLFPISQHPTLVQKIGFHLVICPKSLSLNLVQCCQNFKNVQAGRDKQKGCIYPGETAVVYVHWRELS